MADYDIFAKYYDYVMTDYKWIFDILDEEFKKINNAESILELGCGTGNILKNYEKKYNISGIDLSEKMLETAKSKIPDGKFYNQNIVDFNLNLKFDIIICMFDTINHIMEYQDWVKVFNNCVKHLNTNGLFIFDMNTIKKFGLISQFNPLVKEFDNNIMIMKVIKKTENNVNFNVKFFEQTANNTYMFEENIEEISFYEDDIYSDLIKIFKSVKIKKINNDDRVFFVCRC